MRAASWGVGRIPLHVRGTPPSGNSSGPKLCGRYDCDPSLTPLAHSGFSYVDLVEGLHDGHFYALKRILCHEQQDQEEAQREADMHRLFQHPNILRLMAYCLKERGAKHEAWLLLPFFKVRKTCSDKGGPHEGPFGQSNINMLGTHALVLAILNLGLRRP